MQLLLMECMTMEINLFAIMDGEDILKLLFLRVFLANYFNWAWNQMERFIKQGNILSKRELNIRERILNNEKK
ncbi:hypothetical protein BRO50_01865 [Metamycoplasma hominis]|nr:hypothetical protein BRO50_01865 [Metamycoplasma hominis]